MAGAEAKNLSDRFEGVLGAEGYELVDVEVLMLGGRRVVRVFIDGPDAASKRRSTVTVDDCAKASRLLGDLIDAEALLTGAYHLEVSSPGLYRPLTKEAHFDRAIGERVKVRTFKKIGERRVFTGTLEGREGREIVLSMDGAEVRLALEDVAKANLEPSLGF
jgi:ribosome maturation factor RimP